MNGSELFLRELLEKDPRFAVNLIDGAPIIVLLLSLSGEIQYVNEYFSEVTGYLCDEVVGKDWFDTFLPERDHDRVRAIFEEAITGKPTRGNINPILSRGGKQRQIQWYSNLIQDDDGQTISLLAVGTDVTEALEIQNEREKNRKCLQSVLDTMFAFVGLFDLGGKILEANRAPLEAAGLERSEVLGQPFWETYWWSHSTEVQLKVRDALRSAANGEVVRDDFTVRVKGPNLITIDAVFCPLLDEAGNIVGVVGSGVDITSRKETEERLRASELQLSQAQEMANIGSWELDFSSQKFTWSEETYRMFGFSPQSFTPTYEEFISLVHPDDRALVDATFKDCVTNKKSYSVEHRVICVDGNIKIVEERCQTFYDDGGAPLRSVGTVQDITERKNLEREVSEKAALLETTFQNMSQGITVFNPAHKLVAFNKKYEELGGKPPGFLRLGMSREEILRQRVETGELTEEELLRCLGSSGSVHHLWREQKLSDGRIVLYERTPLPDGTIIGTYTDISDLKATEERLHRAQKMEVIGQLTGGIAHDFNNLLAVILGNVDLLEDEVGKSNESLKLILRASERGAELTHRLLAFARKQSLSPTVCQFDEVLNGVRTLLQRTLGETIKIGCIFSSDLWSANVDVGQLESAILNLAINARDAMPDGGELTFECSNARLTRDDLTDINDMEPGDYICLSVRDTGVGIPLQNIEHVFEPFFTTKGVGDGSGLGLSMVYGFAKQSGGHVSLDSEEGKGTTIMLYLPRAKESQTNSEGAVETEIENGQGELVLILEDDLDVCESVKRMLITLGYRTITAQTAADAGQILERENIDLVLSDVVLAGSERGPIFAQQARALYPKIKFIFMTGYSREADDAKAALSDRETVIKKPFRRVELSRAISNEIK